LTIDYYIKKNKKSKQIKNPNAKKYIAKSNFFVKPPQKSKANYVHQPLKE